MKEAQGLVGDDDIALIDLIMISGVSFFFQNIPTGRDETVGR
jgi:hypothetical protein